MKNEKLIKNRLSKTRIVGKFLAHLPFVRCVILNGSLSSGGHNKSSDIDILIIAKPGHIFTARFFVNVFATIFGVKRSKDDTAGHAGKFCFNYFLTEKFLTIPTGRGEAMDRYCAQNYSASQFVAGDMELYEKFMRTNINLFRTYNCHPELVSGSTNDKLSSRARREIFSKDSFAEFTLSSSNGVGMTRANGWFERVVKKYQIKKIESDPITKKYPNLIVYNDKELRFHPPKSELRIKN